MKLIIAIVQNQDSNQLSDRFLEKGIRATKLSSTGGFLRAGNTTFLIGVEDRKVHNTLEVIKENSQTRKQTMMSPTSFDFTIETNMTYPVEVEVGGATVFVLPIDEFLQF